MYVYKNERRTACDWIVVPLLLWADRTLWMNCGCLDASHPESQLTITGEVVDDISSCGDLDDTAATMQAMHERLLQRGRQLRKALTRLTIKRHERDPRAVMAHLWPLLHSQRLNPNPNPNLWPLLHSQRLSNDVNINPNPTDP